MLEVKVNGKQDLIRLINGSNVKKVVAKDVRTSQDLKDVEQSINNLLKSNKVVTAIIIVE